MFVVARAGPLAFAIVFAASASAGTPAALLDQYRAAAEQESRTFAGFSADQGRAFFTATHGAQWSCSSCHTRDPRSQGRHAKTGKDIQPLAPAANPERFTDAARSEKWFRRNCNDVLGRACTVQEKGDVLAYLLSVGR